MTLASEQTLDFSHYQPLFTLMRGGVSEVVCYGYVIIATPDQLFSGNNKVLNSPLIPRSTLKPWQFLATNVATDNPHWALGLASHSGQSIHQNMVNELIEAYDLQPQNLKCPESYPKDPKAAAPLLVHNKQKQRIYHQCSGKHLMYLAACDKYNFDSASYTAIQHPLNQALLKSFSNIVKNQPTLAYDSCGLPNFVFTTKDYVQLGLHLADSKSMNERIELMFSLWKNNPRLVGGINRLDSDITEDLDGLFFSKEGADGLLMLLHHSPKPIFILVKLAGGHNQKHLCYALWSALKQVESDRQEIKTLKDYLTLKVRDYLPEDQEIALIESARPSC